MKIVSLNRVWLVFVCILAASCIANVQDGGRDTAINEDGRNDEWGYVGYGGGGAMFHPQVSPHDPKTVLVACDMTGSYITSNGGDSWRMFNLKAPVDYFVFDPIDPNVIYANSIALFRSTDAGETWSIFYPAAPEVAGIVSKGDHASEVLVTKDSTRRDVQAFAIDPENSDELYAAISIDGESAVYTSSNGGAEWTRETVLEGPARELFVHPFSPAGSRTLYAAGKDFIAMREGGQWTTNAGPTGVKQLTELSGGVDASGRFVIYAIAGRSYFDPEGEISGIFFTDDGGKSWENRQQGMLDLRISGADMPEWRSIATSAGHSNVVYVSYNNLQTHKDTTCLGVARSDDFGKTWDLSWKDKLVRGGNVVAANYNSGWINKRFGPTWGENPFSLAVSPNDPDICYGTDFGRTTKTEDGGKTWQQVYTNAKNDGWRSRGLEVTTSYSVVFNPFNIDHVFITNTDVGLMQSHDGGVAWTSATQNNGIPRQWVNSTYWMAFDPQVKGKAWAAMSGTHDLPRPKMFRRHGTRGYKGGIVMTADAGKTWTPVSEDIGEAAMTHVLVDETSSPDARVLYACAFGKGVYKSEDGGKTWQPKNEGIEGDEPFAWRIEKRQADGALFLVVSRRSEDGSLGTSGDGALYRSDDGAERWERMTLPSGTNGPMSLVADPENPKRILLSAWGRRTGGRFSPDEGGGIFLSEDDGRTWRHVLSEDQHIHDITFDAQRNVYYACGFNGSAYRSADRGASWQRIKGYNFKWGKRVDVDPRDPSKIFVITFGGGIWYGPAEGDAADTEDIVPPLPYLH